MSMKYAILPVFCLFASAPVLAAGPLRGHSSVPPASFLNYHVSSVHELSQEVTLDPSVRARLANHFHITQAQITTYVRHNLVLTHLQKSGRYTVACVGHDGREYWVQSHLPKGTAVFASRATGNPVLKLACGNPMVSSLPPTIQTADDNGQTGPAQLAALPPPALDSTTPLPGLVPEDLTPPDLLVAATDISPAVVQVSPSIESLIPGSFLSAGGHSFNAIPALLGALAVGVASSGHGGSSPQPGGIVVPAPIPEASSSVSLGMMLLLGAGTLVVLRRKRAAKKAE